MILLVAFPAISKSTINFASLLKKPDPETKMKCDQLSELRKMVVEYAKKSVDQADDLLISLDNYVNMLIDTTPMLIAKGAKNPKFSWQTSMLKSAKEINSSENKIGDFNIEVLMCLFLKAMVKSVLAERILGKLTKQMHPEVEQFKTCWAYLVDAAKIINFIASVGLNYLPKMSASERAGLPELSVEILNGLARLLLAESEMVAIEKGLAEKAPSLTPLKITGVYKDLMNKLDEASNYFNDGLSALSSSAKSNFRKYYLVYCQAMKACYEVNFWHRYATTFEDDKRKFRLGCLQECMRCIDQLRKNYLPTLPEHKEYMLKVIGEKEAFCKKEFDHNNKVYFDSPADAGAIPPVSPIPFSPSLEFIPAGYMNMINSPGPS